MNNKSLLIWRLALGCAALLAPCTAAGQTAAPRIPGREAKPAMVETPDTYRGARYEPNNRRDPFLNPLLLKKAENPDEEVPRGNPPPGIAGMYIKDVDLLGFSISPEGTTAVFRGSDKRVYFLHAGDRMFDGYIKSVSFDSVLLIRESRLRSGKVLIQEVTKRLRTP